MYNLQIEDVIVNDIPSNVDKSMIVTQFVWNLKLSCRNLITNNYDLQLHPNHLTRDDYYFCCKGWKKTCCKHPC
jgi:hypothetical protein